MFKNFTWWGGNQGKQRKVEVQNELPQTKPDNELNILATNNLPPAPNQLSNQPFTMSPINN